MFYHIDHDLSVTGDRTISTEISKRNSVSAGPTSRAGSERTSGMGASRVTESYRITIGDGRSTEELVEAGAYAYAHSCVTSENFPARPSGERREREIVLLEFEHEVTTEEVFADARRLGLVRPVYEDALYFGAQHPAVQRERSVVFLHDPWFGFFGRRDVLCLWTNVGRRELGLEDFDGRWSGHGRFAFVRPASTND
jgi:hypothetical protein